MDFKTKLKKKIILAAIAYKKKKQPFDEKGSELWQLPEGANHEMNNSYFLGGHTVEGDTLSMRIGYRHGGVYELFVLYRHNGRLLHQVNDLIPAEQFPAKVSCIEVGKRWLYEFDGELMDDADRSHHNCSIKVEFDATLPIYDFYHHPEVFEGMARAIANEKWDASFFRELGQMNQRHYEQTGHIKGFICIDGNDTAIDMPAIRDRAFGRRCWNYMDNHIWLSCVTEKGEGFNFSIVNYPALKRIFSGYTNLDLDHNVSLADYKILEYADNDGLGTDKIVVDCLFTDGRTLRVSAQRDSNVLCHFDDGVFVFQEGLGQFDINGTPARGTIEYGFNKNKSRWGNYNENI